MESRFGARRDDRGLLDFHWRDEYSGDQRNTYDPDYAQPSGYLVYLDGCPTAEEAEASRRGDFKTANTYTWTIEGTPYARQNCEFTHRFPTEGTFQVRLKITRPGDIHFQEQAFQQDVDVQDLLIVSIGDSYASGEGNPDVAQETFGPLVTGHPLWIDERCHRSATAGPAQAARTLEGMDLKTSVTFLSFACSGATINTHYDGGTSPLDPFGAGNPEDPIGSGVLGTYRGPEPKDLRNDRYQNHLPSQIDQLDKAVGERRIDALIVSGGGNDIGFGPIASYCVLYTRCPAWPVPSRSGHGRTLLTGRVQEELSALPDKYAALDAEIRRLLNVGKVYVTEYPDSTRDDSGGYCNQMLDDVVPTIPYGSLAGLWMGPLGALYGLAFNYSPRLEHDEVIWAGEYVLRGLNDAVRAAAATHHWEHVGFGEDFATHGYCARDHWIRRAEESNLIQGPFDLLIRNKTKGTLHPNAAGHEQYRRRLVGRLRPDLLPSVAASTPQFRPATDGSRLGTNGWLTGRCPGGAPCLEDHVTATVEITDPEGVRGAGFVAGGGPGCSAAGITCMPEPALFGDGRGYRWSLQLTDGVHQLEFTAGGRDGQVATLIREFKVDLHDPEPATALPVEAASPSGWFRGPVHVVVDGRDAPGGSGVERIEYRIDDGPQSSTGPGANFEVSGEGVHTVRYHAVDFAGRRGPEASLVVRIDATPPVPVCDAPDGAWHGSDVSVACTATDAGGSGLESSAEAAFALSTDVAAGTETAEAATGERRVCDRAGNCSTAGPIAGNRVDKRAPAITIRSPSDGATFVLRRTVPADYLCVDGGAGTEACEAPAAVGAPVDTSAIGPWTFAVTARDRAGNTATAAPVYRVIFHFDGWFPPVADAPTFNVTRAGSSIPVKFSLHGDQGLEVLAAGSPRSESVACDASAPAQDTETAAGSVAGLRYDAGSDQYVYVWRTQSAWAGTCRQFSVRLVDGTTHRAFFRFKP